jgi:hypothetical protein
VVKMAKSGNWSPRVPRGTFATNAQLRGLLLGSRGMSIALLPSFSRELTLPKNATTPAFVALKAHLHFPHPLSSTDDS